ncbi:uncharacterized protein LOC113273003 [Papaver somniferum]|uniref:uncharacterized protein LOC113273003 n=1 Tax=Papaver somniferum TaxID=3469 RepID=UPI000E704CB2|nr:uncharacterized protein LOC113273003 [Papaver somniferum]
MGEDAAEPPTVEKLIEVQIGDEEHKTTFVREDLPAHERDGLITLLRENTDVFTWSFAEMPRIDPNVACHGLNIDEKFHPVRQKIRNMTKSKKYGVTAEVEKLLESGFIRPVQYPRWMSNVVPVPKKNGKICVCIDFTDLNKACPSDPYPLPRIRDLVDATSGYGRLSFMNGFSGYNQIPLFGEDQEHTAFVTARGVYCYNVMPFGLKNTWATYQHLVDHMFKDLIGKTIEVYIHDMVVKSEQKDSHFLDLQKTFDILRQYRMKLNPAKCSFGLSSGNFLGYLMTHRGIEANPEQIRAIREIPSPRTKKEKEVNFGWKDECEKDFDEINQYLSTFPVLVSPKTGQPIGVYLAATENARLDIWSNFLGAYEIKYETRTAEKGNALAALLAYFPVDDIETVIEEEEELFKPIESTTDQTGSESVMEVDTPEPLWTVFTDGSSNVGGAGVGCVIRTPEGSRIEKTTRLGFQASNNEDEHEAAIISLKAVKQHADALACLYSAVDTDTTRFVVVDFQELPSIFDSHFVLALEHASGGERETTSAQGDTENIDNNMDVDNPMIDDSSNLAENTSDWRQPYIRYLTTSELPEDKHLASKVKKNA